MPDSWVPTVLTVQEKSIRIFQVRIQDVSFMEALTVCTEECYKCPSITNRCSCPIWKGLRMGSNSSRAPQAVLLHMLTCILDPLRDGHSNTHGARMFSKQLKAFLLLIGCTMAAMATYVVENASRKAARGVRNALLSATGLDAAVYHVQPWSTYIQ